MRKSILFSMMMVLSIPLWSFGVATAVQQTVRGTVTGADGGPLAGVSVSVVGSQVATSTDESGDYSIAAEGGATLRFTMIGYTSKDAIVSTATLNVTLIPSDQSLEEVVVVGYGTMRKSDLTGAIVTADIEAFREAPNTNILQSVKGTVPGLQIGQTNQAGAEPAIEIRGRNTINGNTSVLIVVDGIIYNGRLGDLNPVDIESVNILKDASSKAIYGAQAANGVMLITTKGGKKGDKPVISYSTYLASQTPTVDMRLRNAEEKKQIIRDIYYENSYLAPDYTQPNPDWDFSNTELVPENVRGIEAGTDFDWWGALTNPGYITDHALTVNGGTEKTSYYLSGGFTKQKGFLRNDNYKRNSVRINLSTELADWLTVGANTFGTFTDYSGIYPNMYTMRLTSPFAGPRDENGEYIIYPTGATNIINPFIDSEADNKDVKTRMNGTFYGIVKVHQVPGLEYRVNFGNDFYLDNYYYSSPYGADLAGLVSKSNQQRYDMTFDNILSYDNRFGDHGISATFVAGYRKNQLEATGAEGTNVSNISLSYNSLQQAEIQRINSGAWNETFLYQMGRVNYNFRNTYMLTATLRNDGFSGFSKNNKSALFPSVGASWVLSNEPFIAIPHLEYLKLRGTYGVNGNMTARYSSLARVTTGDGSKYVFGDGSGTAMGQSIGSLSNDNLSWEKTRGINIGLDFSLFNNRVGGNVDYYNTETTDLLWNVIIPEITGFSDISSNVGKLKNQGIEVILSTTPVKTDDLVWDVNLNFGRNTNKIMSLLGEDKDGDGKEDDLVGSGLFIGKSIGAIYHYQIDGIWQLNDDVMTGYQPGNYRIVDQNEDGRITADDRVFLGQTEPAYTFGIQSGLTYKNVTFRFFVNAIQGGKNGYLGGNSPANVESTGNFANLNTFNYDLWSVSNPTGKYATGWNVPQINPTPYYARSFVRLQDISIAYQFNSSLINRIGIRGLKLIVSGKNLLTFTKWDGWDPETGQGINSDAYPVMKSFNAGLELSL
ncbi:SusC/RagA family TonB-linked outer membrane protein [Parapedobacter sp. 10938]|uniref:SusC/RagA family TonB-linked outer membrane protein n=1 Tax=Parapedobacter flavus TaxID=3110225 RepID=UPI002DBBB03F|nr:SusC/RagA family TonB-linked outer membrane protein [Parapedobacter sp. 10938]MEC3880057.1 SusC/RagA family TonB-linked outer membrane protein [Parapedobacter sp. 10938]